MSTKNEFSQSRFLTTGLQFPQEERADPHSTDGHGAQWLQLHAGRALTRFPGAGMVGTPQTSASSENQPDFTTKKTKVQECQDSAAQLWLTWPGNCVKSQTTFCQPRNIPVERAVVSLLEPDNCQEQHLKGLRKCARKWQLCILFSTFQSTGET